MKTLPLIKMVKVGAKYILIQPNKMILCPKISDFFRPNASLMNPDSNTKIIIEICMILISQEISLSSKTRLSVVSFMSRYTTAAVVENAMEVPVLMELIRIMIMGMITLTTLASFWSSVSSMMVKFCCDSSGSWASSEEDSRHRHDPDRDTSCKINIVLFFSLLENCTWILANH